MITADTSSSWSTPASLHQRIVVPYLAREGMSLPRFGLQPQLDPLPYSREPEEHLVTWETLYPVSGKPRRHG